jgi:hypothetical protein
MKRKSIKLAILSLVLLYLSGAFCLSVAAPGTSSASISAAYSDMNSPQGMFPCEHPTFGCRSAANDHAAIPSSVKTRDPSNTTQTFVGITVTGPPDLAAARLVLYHRAIQIASSQKVPIHLVNSVLSL